MKQDRILIEDRISRLVLSGHDMQLNLHPHWLDTEYEGGIWQFKYDRLDIHSLSKENNIIDINAIIGCVSISKQLMENTIRKVYPAYSVTSFRAGGYLVEPFDEIRETLASNNVYIDSSVASGMVSNNGVFLEIFYLLFCEGSNIRTCKVIALEAVRVRLIKTREEVVLKS